MGVTDRVGSRGESIFEVLITRRCGRADSWFEWTFLGAKNEATDYLLTLVDAPDGPATCYVQVKATPLGYFGTGRRRKLRVKLATKDLQKLQATHSPTYVVGIDTEKECG
jgi:hypothetical protein